MNGLKKVSLGIVLLTLLTLTACSGTKNYNYKMKNSSTDGSVVLTVKGDKVIKYSTNIEIRSYSKSNLQTLQYIRYHSRDALAKMYYDSLKGAKYKIDYNESKKIVNIKLDIDLTKADMQQLYQKRILTDKEVKYISLKDAEKLLSKQGYQMVK